MMHIKIYVYMYFDRYCLMCSSKNLESKKWLETYFRTNEVKIP